ncbi:pilus assembly protein PilP [Comamonas sp. NLF-1-9]|uniref:pilus assembly protein PilP n=1 Tax=Comamonas sp. NLF-1-9 TaxID=2853163 RepID=UPI002102D361|nr:pilus assembly protein PilP [Comamonas sp. NLF-1-9]
MSSRTLIFGALCGGAIVLAGCQPAGQDDLRQWMADLRANTKPHVTPLKEPVEFSPQGYLAGDGIDPFNAQKLTQALRRDTQESAGNASLIAPELTRRKEPLEAYPLDTVTMVGSMVKSGKPTALVTVDKMLYQVQVGNYLGQNYGKIMAINETSMQVREIVQDQSGDWVERMTTLELQEGTGAKK